MVGSAVRMGRAVPGAQKFEDEGVREEIRRQRAVARAVELGRRRHPSYRRDWGPPGPPFARFVKVPQCTTLVKFLDAIPGSGMRAASLQRWATGNDPW